MKTIKISLQGLALKNQRHACLPKTIKFYYFNNLKKYDTALKQQNVVKDNSIQLHHFPKIFLYSFFCDVRGLTIKIPISRKSCQIKSLYFKRKYLNYPIIKCSL